MKPLQSSFCVECGPEVKVDEDGCCAACGGNAMGPWADKAAALFAKERSPVRRAERAIVKASRWRRAAFGGLANDMLDVAVDRLLAAEDRAKRARKR